MVKRATDRRVIKTKRAIKNALMHLLNDRDINDITISDIAAQADINSKTFYNYYSGVHEVIDEMEDDIISHVDESLTDIDFIDNLENPYLIFEKLTSVISTDMDTFGYLLGMNTNVGLLSKMVDLLKAKVKSVIMPVVELDELRLNLMLEFMITGMVAVYKRWFNSDRRASIDEISRQMNVLAFKGLNGYLNLDF